MTDIALLHAHAAVNGQHHAQAPGSMAGWLTTVLLPDFRIRPLPLLPLHGSREAWNAH